MTAPSTPKPAETPIPPEAPEVVEPAAPDPEPPAPPDVEISYHDPFSPIVTSNSERILTCLPIRTIVPSPPSGQSTGGNSAASSGGRYSVLLLIAALSKVTAPENMSASKECYKYAIYEDNGEIRSVLGSNLDWTVVLWDPYKSTATSWNLGVDDAATLISKSKSENSDPSIYKGGIVCGHVTKDYNETVEVIHEKARTHARMRIFDSEDWACKLVDDISGYLRGRGQWQSPRGSIAWATDCSTLRESLRNTAISFPELREDNRYRTANLTGIGLLANDKYVLVDQYFLAMKRHCLPGKLTPSILSFHAYPPEELALLRKDTHTGLSETWSANQVAVLLIPTPYQDPKRKMTEILWKLVLADHMKGDSFSAYFVNPTDGSLEKTTIYSYKTIILESPGGIHIGYCRKFQARSVHRAFRATSPLLDSLQWTLDALKAAAGLEPSPLITPDGRSPVTLESIEAFSTHLTTALNQTVTIVPDDGVGETTMTTREAIWSGQGELVDEHYLHLRRGVWKVLGFGERADKRIPSGSAQADTSHMPTATVPQFLPAHMLGPNGHAILYQQTKTTFDMHPPTYTAGYEMSQRWKR